MKHKEKRKLLREYAQSIGLCVTCLRWDAANGSKCAKCTQANRDAQRRLRQTIGRCRRCGQRGETKKCKCGGSINV